MDQPIRFMIRFDELEAGDAGQAAESLRRTLRDEAPGVEVRRVRVDVETMDLGTTLGVVLTAPAIVELAKGITAWLGRTHSSKITITRPDGTVIVENVSARQATDLTKRLQAAHGG